MVSPEPVGDSKSELCPPIKVSTTLSKAVHLDLSVASHEFTVLAQDLLPPLQTVQSLFQLKKAPIFEDSNLVTTLLLHHKLYKFYPSYPIQPKNFLYV